MLDIHLEIDRPAGQAIGIKEQLAMALEHIGDVRVVSVTETHPEQLKIGGNDGIRIIKGSSNEERVKRWITKS